jgi:ABC-type Na+ efflux pump permease subunit
MVADAVRWRVVTGNYKGAAVTVTNEGASARRGAAIGACVCAGFGAGWFGWSQSAEPHYLHVVSTIGFVVCIAVCAFAAYTLARAGRAARSDADSGSGWTPQTRRSYWITVLIEFGLIAAGAAVLSALKHQPWIPVWTSIVVAVHFYPLADIFQASEMKRLATAMLAVTALALVAVAAGVRVPSGSLTCLGAGCVLLYGAVGALRAARATA